MNYRINVSDWSKIKVESAKFIFYQAESFLKSTVETCAIFSGRALTLIQILIPLIGADFAYLITIISHEFYRKFNFQVLAFILLVLCIALVKAIKMYRIVKVADVGSEPFKLATESMLMTSIEHQELAIIMNEIEIYQERIDANLAENTIKARQYRRILRFLITGFGIALFYSTIFLLSLILQVPFPAQS